MRRACYLVFVAPFLVALIVGALGMHAVIMAMEWALRDGRSR